MINFKNAILILKNSLVFILLILFNTLRSQELDVEGNSTLRGRLSIFMPEDNSTILIGPNTGVNTNFSQQRFNTFLGSNAGLFNTTGSKNSFYGRFAGGLNTTGSKNSFYGFESGLSNMGGQQNAFFGANSGHSNSSGSNNCFIGIDCGNSNSSGQDNVFVGYKAGDFNTDGNYNCYIGSGAGEFNKGEYNTVLGYHAFHTFVDSDIDNVTYVGYGTGGLSTANNRVEIGNSSITWIGGQVDWATYSDRRIKENILDNVPGLAFITRLSPVTYQLNIRKQNSFNEKNVPFESDWKGKYDIEKIRMTGFIAQEVEQAAQEIQFDFSGVHRENDDLGIYSLKYASFVVPLVKAVQEQQGIIENQAKEIAMLKEIVAEHRELQRQLMIEMTRLKNDMEVKRKELAAARD